MAEIIELYGLSYILFLVILFLLFKRFLYSLLDPHVFVIQLFAASLAFSVDSSIIYYLLASIIAFWCGMMIVSPTVKRSCASVQFDKIVDIPLLKTYSVLLFVIYVFANIILYRTSPIPLFTDIPTESKAAISSSGMGWIKRIIYISSFLPVCFSLLIVFSSKKKIYIVLLVLYILISVLLGAKSSFIHIIFLFSFLYTQKNFSECGNETIFQWVKRLFPYMLILVGFIFLFIVLKESENEGGNSLLSVGYRLMAAGDVMLYYKFDWIRDSFLHYNFFDFISNELNGITGMLRITSYNEPIGYLLVKEYLGDDLDTILGPNAPFFIKGHIYWGNLGGILFSLFIGYIYAWIRKKIFLMKVSNLFVYAVWLNIFFLLINFLKESGMFLSRMFDFFLLSLPLIFISNLIVKYKRKTNETKPRLI